MDSHGIKITVETVYEAEHSTPDLKKYVFSYHVRIQNLSHTPCQLIARHWLITDADGAKQEVSGDGVIGEKPHIAPHQEFNYSSAAIIETPVGTMEGFYAMKSENGDTFKAPIPAFLLAVPGSVN